MLTISLLKKRGASWPPPTLQNQPLKKKMKKFGFVVWLLVGFWDVVADNHGFGSAAPTSKMTLLCTFSYQSSLCTFTRKKLIRFWFKKPSEWSHQNPIMLDFRTVIDKYRILCADTNAEILQTCVWVVDFCTVWRAKHLVSRWTNRYFRTCEPQRITFSWISYSLWIASQP